MSTKTRFKRATAVALCGIGLILTSGNAAAGCTGFSPFVGSICSVGFDFCPRGFAEANGQLLAVSQNDALFSLLGTTYGGDGRTTFGLPDLRGRSPVHSGIGPGLTQIRRGQRGGAETSRLIQASMPAHSHMATTDVSIDVTSTLHANSASGDDDDPSGNVLAKRTRTRIYSTGTPDVSMSADAITTTATALATTTTGDTGGSQSFNNRSPYLAIRYCVALVGVYPSRN